MSYYFNGGIYLKDRIKDIREFDAVRPTYGLPYVTSQKTGISGAEHHSSVYQISEDFKKAILVKDNGAVPSPKEVKLPSKLQMELMQAVKHFEAKQAATQS